MEKLRKRFVMGKSWTGEELLPGGDIGPQGIDGLVEEIVERHPYINQTLACRLASSYGTRAWKIVASAAKTADLGARIVSDLHQVELDYLRREEWARSAEYILWRRTKLGLVATAHEIAALKEALSAPLAAAS
jgi:glycerol-3-phosphate dehydrogenase